jgi:hypothetical protein
VWIIATQEIPLLHPFLPTKSHAHCANDEYLYGGTVPRGGSLAERKRHRGLYSTLQVEAGMAQQRQTNEDHKQQQTTTTTKAWID